MPQDRRLEIKWHVDTSQSKQDIVRRVAQCIRCDVRRSVRNVRKPQRRNVRVFKQLNPHDPHTVVVRWSRTHRHSLRENKGIEVNTKKNTIPQKRNPRPREARARILRPDANTQEAKPTNNATTSSTVFNSRQSTK